MKKALFLIIPFLMLSSVAIAQDPLIEKYKKEFKELGIPEESVDGLLQMITQIRETYKSLGYTEEQMEKIIDSTLESMLDQFKTQEEKLKNQKEMTEEEALDVIKNSYKENLNETNLERIKIAEEKGKLNEEYFSTTLNLMYLHLALKDTISANNLAQELERLKFQIIDEYGFSHPKYKEISYWAAFTNYSTTGNTESLARFEKGGDSKTLSIEAEFNKSTKESWIAQVVSSSTHAASGASYMYLFQDYVSYSKNTTVSDELRSRLGIGGGSLKEFIPELIRDVYMNSDYTNYERTIAFSKMVNQLGKMINERLKTYEESTVTVEQMLKSFKEKGLYQNLSAEQQKQYAEAQVNQFNFAINATTDITGVYEFKSSIDKIITSPKGLRLDVNRFINEFEWFHDYRAGLKRDRVTHAKSIKYDPERLLRYSEYVLNEVNEILESGKVSARETQTFEIIKKHYEQAGRLIDINQNETTTNDLNTLQQWGAYRDVLLNIALDSYNQNFSLLDNNRYSFITYNDLLALKGSDFRSKKFILDGLRNANSEPLVEYYDKIKSRRAELSSLALLGVKELSQKGWTQQKLDDEIEKLLNKEQELFTIMQDYVNMNEYFEQWAIDWQEIKSSLTTKEAFIDIQRIESLSDTADINYFVTVITNRGANHFVLDEGYKMENEYYLQYRNQVLNTAGLKEDDRGVKSLMGQGSDTSDFDSQKIYWTPFTKSLSSSINKFYISSDGIYHKISVGALWDKTADSYLLEDNEIISVNDFSDFKSIKSTQGKSAANKFHLFGRPDYYLTTNTVGNTSTVGSVTSSASRAFTNNSVITDLVGTEREVNQIGDILNKYEKNPAIYIKEKASESKIKSLNNPEVLHIATHGFFSEEVPSQKFGSGYFGYAKEQFINNPLLRSGLLFAGAGNSLKGNSSGEEDGILTGEEIIHLPLIDTDLVVLSACETGVGLLYNGEGVMGLQRSFLIAGAKSVIMSLWEVDDTATQELMVTFYNKWINENLNKREAFRQAQIELKKEYPAPYYWGAFVMLGE